MKKPVTMIVMYAITHIDNNQKRSILTKNNQYCIFTTKAEAQNFERTELVPHIKSLITNGHFIKRRFFSNVYKPLTQEEKRKYNRMLETMMIEPIKRITFDKER